MPYKTSHMKHVKHYTLTRLAVLSAAGLSLAACATSQSVPGHSEGFGQATAHNRAVHEVKPTAEQKNNTYIPADAGRQTIAREKYRNNEVEAQGRVNTR